MNLYYQIISLERNIMEELKVPSNNSTFKDALRDVLEALKNLQTFY